MKKIFLLILVFLLLTASNGLCYSEKPSAQELYRTALDEFHQNVCAKNQCKQESERFCTYLNYNDNPRRVFATLCYFLGTEIVKNSSKKDAKDYPFLGISYHQLTIVHTVKCSDFNIDSYKKTFENKLRKLKIDDFRNVDYIDVEGSDALPMTSSKIYTEHFKWNKKTKKWQLQAGTEEK